MASTDPVEIRRVDPQTLSVRWQDGHESHYAITALRGMCRCAVCGELPPHPADTLTYDHVSLVGRYAISIRFSDGHETGIYPFELLRENCPCSACLRGAR